jgi:hypothetical protein
MVYIVEWDKEEGGVAKKPEIKNKKADLSIGLFYFQIVDMD